MADMHIITIYDLLSLSLPLSGAASLSISSCSPLKKHKPQPPQVIETKSLENLLIPRKHLNPELFFTSLNCFVIIVGTVDLPVHPSDNFFSFSDGSSSISCAVLDFDIKIIGCKIHVLAWNFLPFRHQDGGLLEIIRWSRFPTLPMPKDMPVISLRKGAELPSRKTIVGVLRSVSPVFTVPCRNSGSDPDSIGFLAEVFTCKCSICAKPRSVDRYIFSLGKQSSHCFTASEIVYFLKPSSGWRLALTKLVGRVIMVSGLKKKMIFVGETTSYAMYVTPMETSVSLGQLPLEATQLGGEIRARKIDDGAVYSGIITGVYMQGMAIELDNKVWLLVMDPNLAPIAALRHEVDTGTSYSSSLFAEAMLLPYDAIFFDEDAHNHSPGFPLRKLDGEAAYAESISDSSSSNYDLKLAQVRAGFPCILTFARRTPQTHVDGYIYDKKCSLLENKSASLHPFLFEFMSDSFVKYQSLHVGGYYIMKCSKECPFCFCNDEQKSTTAKVLIFFETTFWKVTFSFGMAQHQEVQPAHWLPPTNNLVRENLTCSGNACQNDSVFLQSICPQNGISDVHLVISSNKLGSSSQIKSLEEELLNHYTVLQEVLSVTSFIRIMKLDMPCSSRHDGSKHRSLFNTNLVSICGNIENMHLRTFENGSCHRRDTCICLHVYDGQSMVYIRGKLHHYAYPVGLGPGVNATFHRVLVKCASQGFPKLILTSVSLIVINSVKETGCQCRKKLISPPQFDKNGEVAHNSVLSLISQSIQLSDVKHARFLCRVVAIHFLVLEKLDLDHGGTTLRMEMKMPSIKIPLAGFLLDDGSSICCCWTDAERAETLLRLSEISCHPFFQCHRRSVKKNVGFHETIAYQLDKMLNKHHKVVVKNYRVVPDAASLDFVFHADSSEVFNGAEESLLKFFLGNACQGPTFSIIAHLIDSTTSRLLDEEKYKDLQDIVRPLPAIWAAEIEHIDSVKHARNLLYELSAR